MNKLYRRLLSLLLVPTLVLTFFAMNALVNAPAAHAATRDVQNSNAPNDPGGECAPATTYDWSYTGTASNIPNGQGGTISIAKATTHATFLFDGACGTPVVTFKSCTDAPRQAVAPNPSCNSYNTGSTMKAVYAYGNNDVVYQSITLCTLTVRLGSDEDGDLLEDTAGTNC